MKRTALVVSLCAAGILFETASARAQESSPSQIPGAGSAEDLQFAMGLDPKLDLLPDRECYDPGDIVRVDIFMSDVSDLPLAIAGGQFFLTYDTDVLDPAGGRICVGGLNDGQPCETGADCPVDPDNPGFTFCSLICAGGSNDGNACEEDSDCPAGFCTDGADTIDGIFENELVQVIDEGGGTIDYAVGAPFGSPGTFEDSVMARLVFVAGLGDACLEEAVVAFRENMPPTKLTDVDANTILPELTDLTQVSVDDQAPSVADLVTSSPPVGDGCQTTVTLETSISDNCCVMADDVEVTANLTGNGAELGELICEKTQVDASNVDISCTVDVSNLVDCTTEVELVVDVDDCCGNPAETAVVSAPVIDDVPPAIAPITGEDVVVDAEFCDGEAVLTTTVTDNCFVDAGDVTAQITSGAGVTSGIPDCAFMQIDERNVEVTCVVPVSDVTDCSDAAVTMTVSAGDLCDNPAVQAAGSVQVLDTALPGITCDAVDVFLNDECRAAIDFTGSVVDGCCVDPALVKVATFLTEGCGMIGLTFGTEQVGLNQVDVDGMVQVIDMDCCFSQALIVVNGADCCTNDGDTCFVTANVTNAIPPTISCPSDVVISCTDDIPAAAQSLAEFTQQGGSAEGGCGAPLDEFEAAPDVSQGACPQTITREYRVASCGIEATCTQLITIDDTEDPTISCASEPFEANNDMGQCGAVVNYPDPEAMDNCGIESVVCEPPSGSFFNVGDTSVTCTATDECDNTAACSFDVSVADTEDPEITCQANVTVDSDPDVCGAVVTFDTPAAMDNCGIQSVVCDRQSGEFFDVGVTTITCTATDDSGNSEDCTFDVTVNDTQDPEIECLNDITLPAVAGECGRVINYPTPFATDNCVDGNGGDEGPGVDVVCDPPSGSFFEVGGTIVTCTATDPSSNTASCEFTVTITDGEDPEITCPSSIFQPSDPETCSATVDYAAPEAMDNCEIQSVDCSVPSGSVFDLGETEVTCTATDDSGNTDECMFTVTVTDDQQPVVSCPADVSVSSDDGLCSAIVFYDDPTAMDNCDGVGPPLMVECDLPSGSVFDAGMTTVTCTATDGAQNMGMCDFTVTVNDDEDPQVECPTDITLPTAPDACGANVDYTVPSAMDNCPDAIVQCDPPSGFFEAGVTDVTCTATDSSNNTDTCMFTVTIVDSEDPEITCPANVVVDNDPGDCGAIVDYNDPMATDDCGIQTVMCSIPSGSLFDEGMTTVTCTATDTSNNSADCMFTVTVNDAEDPQIECADDVSMSNDPGFCSAAVDFEAPDASDNCELDDVGCDPMSGSIFDVGEATVTCTAEDEDGNDTSCELTVTVTDDEDPVFDPYGDVSVGNDLGECGAMVIYDLPTASDNCGLVAPVDVVCDPPSGSFFDEGDTTVTCTATDGADNTDTLEFTVTVNDTEDPVAICPQDITVDSDPGACSAVIVDFGAASSDNCPGETIMCSPMAGSEFDVGLTTVTCTATDAVGNTGACEFDVIVEPTTNLDLVVEVEGLLLDTDRCVDVTLVDCSDPGNNYAFTLDIPYTAALDEPGGLGMQSTTVPCGSWSCIGVKDPQHTQRRVQPLLNDGEVFTSDFLGIRECTGGENDGDPCVTNADCPPFGEGQCSLVDGVFLVSGDYDNDNLIDVEDFGAWTEFFFQAIPPDTVPCLDEYPSPLDPALFHPDANADGIVNLFDLQFVTILNHFGTSGDPLEACCIAGVMAPEFPRISITFEEYATRVSASGAAKADVNQDGMIDVRDIVIVAETYGLPVSDELRSLADSLRSVDAAIQGPRSSGRLQER